MINACMATFPRREDVMRRAVTSILPQVDLLFVYLNEYDYVPEILQQDKIITVQEPEGDLGDVGKFYWTNKIGGYILTIDDDFIYPPDYVWRTVEKLQQYDNQIVATYHGRTIADWPIQSFYNKANGDYYRCLNGQNRDTWLHIGGTGVMGFHSDLIDIVTDDFEHLNMTDVYLSMYCQQNQIPILSIARRKGWITYNPLMESKATIWKSYRYDHDIQTKLINSIPWQLHSKPLLPSGSAPK